MATVWRIAGRYLETCNCDYLCPCIFTNQVALPTHGECIVALAYHIERGNYGDLSLSDLTFILVARTPEEMGKGNYSVGIFVDERADEQQRAALTVITQGQAGGPPAALAAITTNFLGLEFVPIEFAGSDLAWSVTVPGKLDEAVRGVPSHVKPGEPLYIDNVRHRANSRLALATATRSHVHAFGFDWDDTSGKNNGHFAPFDWQGP
ncbi:MAG: DUF1326 domain-containing protein [Chloroflexi bacterium]|nr:DUF1326 domain-containing protein [Chloroflexota bacterium]